MFDFVSFVLKTIEVQFVLFAPQNNIIECMYKLFWDQAEHFLKQIILFHGSGSRKSKLEI